MFHILEWDFTNDSPGELPRPSAIGRLLHEVSYEGNARHYRNGGLGRENVLTVEVFSAMDLLPRSRFLGSVLRAATGADEVRKSFTDVVEEATVDVLAGDLRPSLPNGGAAEWTIQPDVKITSPRGACLVEAKRLRTGSFQTRQLGRLALTVLDLARNQEAFALLVLPEPPPVRVNGHGRLTIPDAIRIEPTEHATDIEALVAQRIAWITWQQLDTAVNTAAATFEADDLSVRRSIERLAAEVSNAIRRHS